ncbi:uncharacterized protein LOC129944522 [Eupeodes corollae]|uniref:uncharacterized protein LOC129944522 n=1 Tax=Eupeodes corollae TaxID=290404 RepID=UPI002491F80C|nr:uncharacterized protein LOC129944522 [Eupeodes corollae]XP_055909984.1 uncharacterized protein LOC129944522 [Eupeodes corollae]
MSTTRVHHKPASVNPFASYAYQENEENEDELEDEEDDNDDDGGDEMEWSDEEDIHDGYIDDSYIDDDLEEDFEDDYDSENYDHKFDDDYEYDSDTEEVDHDDEYLDDDDEEESHFKNNNYASAGPGYFYPEQPYIGPPIVPKPEPEASSSKLRYYVLSPICDIATIYIKFAILAILVYACALWYTVYFGDLSSITTISDMDDNDADTCPA